MLILTSSTKHSPSLPIGMEWSLRPGSQKLTTRFFSVQISGSNTGLFDVVPPKIKIELRAKGKAISQTVSSSYGFNESTGDVSLKVEDDNPKRILTNTVALMIKEELVQKNVSLHLLDVVTETELARIEKIEVAISL